MQPAILHYQADGAVSLGLGIGMYQVEKDVRA